MDEEVAALEHYLIMACSADQEELNEATEYIQQVIQDVDVIDDFEDIIRMSENPLAVSQACLQMTRMLKIYWRGFNLKVKTNYGTFFLNILNGPNEVQATDMCIRSIMSVLSFIFQKLRRTWPALIEYVTAIASDFSPIRFTVLANSIQYFKDEEILANQQLFLEAATTALSQSEDWTLIIDALKILIRFIPVSTEELEGIMQLIEALPTAVTAAPLQNQLDFFGLMKKVFATGQTTEGIVEAILTVAQSEEVLPEVGIAAINTIGDIIKEFDEERVDAVLTIALQQGARLAESEGILPKDYLTFVAKVVKSFPRAAVYVSIKQKIEEARAAESQPLLVAGILMVIPVIQYAPELISGEEVNFCSEIIKTGLETEDSLCIQAVCYLVQEMSNIDAMASFLPQYIPSFIQYAQNEEDSELSMESLRALNEIVEMQQTLPEETLPQVWQLYKSIPVDKQQMFLDIVYHCILLTDKIDSGIIAQMFEFISPVIGNPEQDPNLASTCLLVCGAIIGKDETQVDKLETTAQITLSILEKDEDQSTRNALTFLGDICDALGEDAAGFMEQFAEGIQEIIANEFDTNYEKWVCALRTACYAIRYSGMMNFLEQVSEFLVSMLTEERRSVLDDALLNIKLVAKFLDAEQSAQIYQEILDIARSDKEWEDPDSLLSFAFQALAKVIKSNKEENGEFYFEQGFQLCNEFVSGELPALEGVQFTDSETDFDVDLLHYFANFAKNICGMSTEASDAIITAFLEVVNRPFEAYRKTLTEVFIGAVEDETVSESAVQGYLGVVEQLIENATPNESQQEIIYVLNLLLRKFPDTLSVVQTLLPKIAEWWGFARQNRTVFEALASNIASLFLNVELHAPGFNQQLLLESLEFFPPADSTECVSMIQCLIEILGRGEVPQDLQILSTRGITTLLTKPQSVFRRMKISQEMQEALVGTLKQLVTIECNMQAAMAVVEGSEPMTAKLQSILQ